MFLPATQGTDLPEWAESTAALHLGAAAPRFSTGAQRIDVSVGNCGLYRHLKRSPQRDFRQDLLMLLFINKYLHLFLVTSFFSHSFAQATRCGQTDGQLWQSCYPKGLLHHFFKTLF